MHHAVQRGAIDVLNFVLKHGGAGLINQRTANDSTPLHWATTSGSLKTVQTLVEAGACLEAATNTWSVDVFGRESGTLSIHWAASAGHDDIVEYLYNLAPTTMGIKDEKGNTVYDASKKGLNFTTMKFIESTMQDEYVPVRLSVHVVEQNMLFDPKALLQQNNANSNARSESYVDVD